MDRINSNSIHTLFSNNIDTITARRKSLSRVSKNIMRIVPNEPLEDNYSEEYQTQRNNFISIYSR